MYTKQQNNKIFLYLNKQTETKRKQRKRNFQKLGIIYREKNR